MIKNLIIIFISFFIFKMPVFAINKTSEIRVMAAASLTEPFNEIKNNFEKKYPNIKIEINYSGSQQLFTQIEQGVEADLFASANEFYVKKLINENLAVNPQIFARNKLAIAVSKNAQNIKTIEDLAKPCIKLAIADKSVPVGKYTMEVFSNYRLNFLKNVVTEELNVKSVLTKVELGEVDAGIVYATDITPKVRTISIKDKYNVVATYPIVLIKDSKHPQEAKIFINFVLSPDGQNILSKYGFMKKNGY